MRGNFPRWEGDRAVHDGLDLSLTVELTSRHTAHQELLTLPSLPMTAGQLNALRRYQDTFHAWQTD